MAVRLRLALATVGMLVGSACIGPAQSIGAVDDVVTDGEVSTLETGVVGTTELSSSTGLGEAGELEGTTDDSGCTAPCQAVHPCQQPRCLDGQCVLVFQDDVCAPGESCGPLGCEPDPLRCGEGDPAVLLCEDFEGAGFSPAWDGGSLDTTAAFANSGSIAGEVTVAPDGRQQLSYQTPAPLTDGLLAIRAFVRLPAADAVESWSILFEIIGGSDPGNERTSLDLRDQAGLLFVTFLATGANLGGNDLLTPGAWTCVELRLTLSDTAGSMELRVDDQTVLVNGPGVDTVPVDGVARIGVGAVASPIHAGDTTYAIDDIVIARAPIGCVVG